MSEKFETNDHKVFHHKQDFYQTFGYDLSIETDMKKKQFSIITNDNESFKFEAIILVIYIVNIIQTLLR